MRIEKGPTKEVFVDIRVKIDLESEHTIYDDGTGEVDYYLQPTYVEHRGGTVPEDMSEGLLESLVQSDFGQINVKDALLYALGGVSGEIKR